VTFSFLPEAEAEYLNAISFYEERRHGLGAGLIQEFERTMQLASERATVGRIVRGQGIRRVDLSRFPYAIFFSCLPMAVYRSLRSPITVDARATGWAAEPDKR
jgi:toxin ParE1/3/4